METHATLQQRINEVIRRIKMNEQISADEMREVVRAKRLQRTALPPEKKSRSKSKTTTLSVDQLDALGLPPE